MRQQRPHEALRRKDEAAQQGSQVLHQRSQELMERSQALQERFATERPVPAVDLGGEEHRRHCAARAQAG